MSTPRAAACLSANRCGVRNGALTLSCAAKEGTAGDAAGKDPALARSAVPSARLCAAASSPTVPCASPTAPATAAGGPAARPVRHPRPLLRPTGERVCEARPVSERGRAELVWRGVQGQCAWRPSYLAVELPIALAALLSLCPAASVPSPPGTKPLCPAQPLTSVQGGAHPLPHHGPPAQADALFWPEEGAGGVGGARGSGGNSCRLWSRLPRCSLHAASSAHLRPPTPLPLCAPPPRRRSCWTTWPTSSTTCSASSTCTRVRPGGCRYRPMWHWPHPCCFRSAPHLAQPTSCASPACTCLAKPGLPLSNCYRRLPGCGAVPRNPVRL